MNFSKDSFLLLVLWAITFSGRAQSLVFENFDAGIPASWIVVDGGTTTDTWFGTTNGYQNNRLDGTEFAFVNSDAAGNGASIVLNELLVSPVINGNLYSQVFLEFDHYYREVSLDSGFVEVFDGNSWAVLATYSSDTGAWGMPDHPVFNLTPYLNSNLKVRFRYMDNTIWAWYWAIDNVHIWAPLMLDAELVGVHLPPGNCGFSSSEIIAVDIHNSGLDTLNGYAVSYQINGGNPVTEMAMLQVLSGDTGTYVFNTVANLSGAGSYTVRAWVSLVGDGDLSNDTLLPLSIVNHPKVSVFPHFEDYEAGAGDWVAGGTNASWAWGTPAKSVIVGAASGSKAWVTGGTGMMGYNNYEESWVESPCFDLSTVSNPWVGLDVWWNSEFSFDGAVLQATSDGGVTWQRIGMFGDGYNWYTDNGIDGLPGGQNNGWTGRAASMNGSNGYRRAVHDLIAFGGASEVIFRLAFASDFSVSDDGFAWDNFTLAQRPFINLGPDRVVCDSFVLDAGLADSYLWTTGDTSRLLTVDSSGSYSVEIRDSFGFPVSDQVLVTILKTGDLNLGEDTLLCGATFFSLLADPGGQSFLWSTGDTLPGLQVSNSGIYSVMVTYGPGCIDMDTVSIDFSSLQAGIVLATDTVCTNTFVSFLDGSTGAISWLWDFGDGNFSLNANPIHAYSSGGTYLVSLMVTDSFCTDSVVLPVFADICTGLEGRGNLVGIQLGPNPARDLTFLYMNVGGSGTAEMEVLDLLGRQIMRKNWFLEAGEQRKKVDLHGLSSGIYLLRVHFDGLIYEQKLWILEE